MYQVVLGGVNFASHVQSCNNRQSPPWPSSCQLHVLFALPPCVSKAQTPYDQKSMQEKKPFAQPVTWSKSFGSGILEPVAHCPELLWATSSKKNRMYRGGQTFPGRSTVCLHSRAARELLITPVRQWCATSCRPALAQWSYAVRLIREHSSAST